MLWWDTGLSLGLCNARRRISSPKCAELVGLQTRRPVCWCPKAQRPACRACPLSCHAHAPTKGSVVSMRVGGLVRYRMSWFTAEASHSARMPGATPGATSAYALGRWMSSGASSRPANSCVSTPSGALERASNRFDVLRSSAEPCEAGRLEFEPAERRQAGPPESRGQKLCSSPCFHHLASIAGACFAWGRRRPPHGEPAGCSAGKRCLFAATSPRARPGHG